MKSWSVVTVYAELLCSSDAHKYLLPRKDISQPITGPVAVYYWEIFYHRSYGVWPAFLMVNVRNIKYSKTGLICIKTDPDKQIFLLTLSCNVLNKEFVRVRVCMCVSFLVMRCVDTADETDKPLPKCECEVLELQYRGRGGSDWCGDI